METDPTDTELESQMAPSRAKILTWIQRSAKIGLGIILAVHVYGLLLRFVPVPGTFLMAQRAMEGEDVRRDWTRIEDISPYLIFAIIGAEDSRFCQHGGIDWKAIEQVMDERGSSKRRRGGSTLTQQSAKNVFLWNGGGWVRKLPEAWLALYVDKVWGKKRVMEIYLNVAEWGDGIFGAQAAARARFGKSAKDLPPREAALMAAVLPSPHKWRLDPPGDYVNKRANALTLRAADVVWGGYGSCVKIDTKGLVFIKPPKEVETEAEPEDVEDIVEPEPDIETPKTKNADTEVLEIEISETNDPEVSDPAVETTEIIDSEPAGIAKDDEVEDDDED